MAINVTINGSGGITGWSGTTARPGEDIVGTTYDASAGAVCVCRYKFTTDAYGATGISFRLNNVRCTVRGSSSSDDSIGRMRFAVGTAAEAYVGYKGNKGCAITAYSYADKYASGSLSVKLLPNTVYYLWVFPASNFSGTTRFNLGSCTLKTSGVYGTASSISASDGVFGGAIPITLSNSVSGVTNTVTVSCGGITRTLAARSAAANFSWSPSLSEYGPAIPNAGSAPATITATTFYGGAEWGSRSKTVTVSFPAAAAPEISEALLSCDNSGTAAEGLSVYVQGHSKARAAVTAAAKYGASVSGYALSVGGATVSGGASVLTSAPLPVSGSLTATVTVTDSRGLKASVTRSLTVEPYAQPVLTGVSLYRGDQTGAPAEDGTCLCARAAGSVSPLAGQNTMTMSVAFRTRTGSFGTEHAMSGGTTLAVPGLDPDLSYVARITLTDGLGSQAAAQAAVNSQKWAMKFNADATAVGFGKAPEAARVLEIPADWNIRRGAASALFSDDALPADSLTGILPLEHGGTGAATAAAARTGLGLGSWATVSNMTAKLSLQSYSIAVSIGAGAYASGTFSISLSGYRPIAIIGIDGSGTNSTQCAPIRWYITNRANGSGTISYLIRNYASAAASLTFKPVVLWMSVT